MKVLITGATGLIGSAIVKKCHDKGIAVNYLTSSKDKVKSKKNYKGFYWNLDNGSMDATCFEGVDTIINLAGESISKRWTSANKTKIIESRVNTLGLIYKTLSTLNHTVKHIISASAIGIYPDSLTNYYEETFTETSNTFLGEVADQWEAKVDDFSQLGISVSKIRIGLVLSKNGGALPELVKPTQFGLGAVFGSGKQWQSWIHIEDLARIVVFMLKEKHIGTFNAVAPNPVTNSEFTKAVAKTLNRPLVLPNLPKSLMQLVLGEMHVLLFESQRVSSKKIETKGFHFKFHHLEPALIHLL